MAEGKANAKSLRQEHIWLPFHHSDLFLFFILKTFIYPFERDR